MSFQWNITPPDKDNLVRTPGIETGKVEWWYSIPRYQTQLQVGSIIVLKFHGGMYWSARGEQSYSPAKFMVLRIQEIREQEGYSYPKIYSCEEVVEFPLRREK
jgi:hypothetical protein